jgi:hypothetical protein
LSNQNNFRNWKRINRPTGPAPARGHSGSPLVRLARPRGFARPNVVVAFWAGPRGTLPGRARRGVAARAVLAAASPPAVSRAAKRRRRFAREPEQREGSAGQVSAEGNSPWRFVTGDGRQTGRRGGTLDGGVYYSGRR